MISVATTNISEISYNSAKSGGAPSGDSGEYKTLMELLMEDKFTINNKTRNNLVSNVFTTSPMEIFSRYKNPLDGDKKYLLTGFSLNLIDESSECTFMEYDDTTAINLI